MTDEHVWAAYRARAAEYTARFGSVEDMHQLDRQRKEQWAKGIEGQVVDAGCGPGHWTNNLHRRGVKVQGVDLVPELIATARARWPVVGLTSRFGTRRSSPRPTRGSFPRHSTGTKS